MDFYCFLSLANFLCDKPRCQTQTHSAPANHLFILLGWAGSLSRSLSPFLAVSLFFALALHKASDLIEQNKPFSYARIEANTSHYTLPETELRLELELELELQQAWGEQESVSLSLSGFVVMGCDSCGNYVRHLTRGRFRLSLWRSSPRNYPQLLLLLLLLLSSPLLRVPKCAKSRGERASRVESIRRCLCQRIITSLARREGGMENWKQAKGSGC